MLIVSTQGACAEQSESESQNIEISNVFSWATNGSPQWSTGIIYALLGMVGALVTIFGLIGGVIPGTAGQAKIEIDENRLERWHKKLDGVLESPSPDPDLISSIENATNNLRDDIRAERWRQFGVAACIYIILGAFFSALLAQDILQALVIGAGWTGFIGTLGLKTDYKERKSVKDAFLDKQRREIEELKEKLEKKGVSREESDKITTERLFTPIVEGKIGKMLDLEKDFFIARSL